MEDNSCGVFPPPKLGDVAEMSVVCSRAAKKAAEGYITGLRRNGQDTRKGERISITLRR